MEEGISCNAEVNELQDKITFTENIEGIDEWPHSFPDGEISYRLNNFSDDFKDSWQTRAVTVALRTWKLRIKNIYFRRERNPNTHVDFNVSWENLAHFDNRKGVLAHAYFPGQGDISGDCHKVWVFKLVNGKLGIPILVGFEIIFTKSCE